MILFTGKGTAAASASPKQRERPLIGTGPGWVDNQQAVYLGIYRLMRLLAIWLFACVAFQLSIGPAAAQGVRVGQPNAAGFPEVVLYVHPRDAGGRLIPDLTTGGFAIAEDGVPVTPLRVEARGGSLDVVLTLDASLSMRDEGRLERARFAASAFVDHLTEGDRVGYLSFADESVLEHPLSGDWSAVQAGIAGTVPRGSTTAFYDSLYWGIAQVALDRVRHGNLVASTRGRADARRVVVALTDGEDNASTVTSDQVIRLARAHGVTICVIALGSDVPVGALQYLTGATGGLYLRAHHPEALGALYQQLARELREEYRILIRSPRPVADASRRTIQVALSGDARLSGTTWYQAPGPGSLLVTLTPLGTEAAAPLAAATTEPQPLRERILLGALLLALGAAIVAAAVFWLRRNRHEMLNIVDSNPQLNLMPLWVYGGTTLVGRGEECELVLDSRQISRVHARIVAEAGAYRVVDEGSRNGTYVNGRRVRRSADLREGDVIRFGDREFRFSGELPG
jgi:Mg-chelatase subunit ChlD